MELLIFIIILGVIYLFVKAEKDKPAPPGTDYRRASIDGFTGKCSGKELDKRISNGYYVKKDKK